MIVNGSVHPVHRPTQQIMDKIDAVGEHPEVMNRFSPENPARQVGAGRKREDERGEEQNYGEVRPGNADQDEYAQGEAQGNPSIGGKPLSSAGAEYPGGKDS